MDLFQQIDSDAQNEFGVFLNLVSQDKPKLSKLSSQANLISAQTKQVLGDERLVEYVKMFANSS